MVNYSFSMALTGAIGGYAVGLINGAFSPLGAPQLFTTAGSTTVIAAGGSQLIRFSANDSVGIIVEPSGSEDFTVFNPFINLTKVAN
jgi:hypothetical protein